MGFTALTGQFPEAMAVLLAGQGRGLYVYLEYSEDENALASFTVASDLNPYFDNPLSYYSGALSNKQNYLRVEAFRHPVVVASTAVAPPVTTQKSTITYLGQSTEDSAGVNAGGQTFADGVTLYGSALVLARDPDDPTQDLVLSRSYFVADYLEKLAGAPISVTMPLSFASTMTDA